MSYFPLQAQAVGAAESFGKVVHPLMDQVRLASATPDAAADFFTRLLPPSPNMRPKAADLLIHPYLVACYHQMCKHSNTEAADSSAAGATSQPYVLAPGGDPTVIQQPSQDELAVCFPSYIHCSQPVLPACDSARLLTTPESLPSVRIGTSLARTADCPASTIPNVVTPTTSEDEQAQASPLSTVASFPIDTAEYETGDISSHPISCADNEDEQLVSYPVDCTDHGNAQLASYAIDCPDYQIEQLASFPILCESFDNDQDFSIQPVDASGAVGIHSHPIFRDQHSTVQCHALQLDDDKDVLLDNVEDDSQEDAADFDVDYASDDEYAESVGDNLAAFLEAPGLLDEYPICDR